MSEAMNEQELAAYVSAKVKSSMNREGDGLSTYRVDMLQRYRGEKYGNEKEGQSKVTTREIMETVEWALPSILDVFASGDKIVVFDPVGPEDEEASEQETKIVNHHLLKKNNGFRHKHQTQHNNRYRGQYTHYKSPRRSYKLLITRRNRIISEKSCNCMER